MSTFCGLFEVLVRYLHGISEGKGKNKFDLLKFKLRYALWRQCRSSILLTQQILIKTIVPHNLGKIWGRGFIKECSAWVESLVAARERVTPPCKAKLSNPCTSIHFLGEPSLGCHILGFDILPMTTGQETICVRETNVSINQYA